jgi:hypothetical protein
VGALGSQRLQARRARRAQVIDRFIEVVGSDSREARVRAIAMAMSEVARVGDRTMLRRYLAARESAEYVYEEVHALHSILLDAINKERASGRLEPLELNDIHAMILNPESYADQRAWENGEPVPKIEPPQSASQRQSKRRRR